MMRHLNFFTFFQAILIIAHNPVTGVGWKIVDDIKSPQPPLVCHEETMEKFIECIEGNTYSAHDVLMFSNSAVHPSNLRPIYKDDKIDHLYAAHSNKSIRVKPQYVDDWNGMGLFLYSDPGFISEKMDSTLQLHLVNNISYYIVIADPKLMIATARPDSAPTTMIKLKEGAGMTYLFLKVSSSGSVV